MKPSGKVNPVSVLLLLGLIAGVWAVVTYFPVYWDNLSVREVASGAAITYLSKDEEGVLREVLRRTNTMGAEGTIGWHFEEDEDGVEQKKPGLGLTEDNVTVSFDQPTRTLTVHISYDRVVELKPFDKRKLVHFEVEKKTVLK